MPATGLLRLLPAVPRGALVAALAAGCAHTGAPRLDPEVMPVLPSPRADVYTRAPGTPNDPLVASVAGGLPWDEALAGVATGIALAEIAGEKVDSCSVRWIASVAGYPYPVRGWLATDTAKGEVPERLLEQARAHARNAVDIGLVRARSSSGDRWVLVVADRGAEVPAIPREASPGAEIALGQGEWVIADPLGELRETNGALVLDAPGEWLLQARTNGRAIATMPVYVGEAPPEAPPMSCVARSGDDDARVAAIVGELRARYEYTALARDPALDSVARARLRALAAGEEPAPALDQLRAAGFIGVPVAAGTCRAATVEACLEQMWWSPEDRGALVGDLAEYGLAVDADRAGVRVVIVGAG